MAPVKQKRMHASHKKRHGLHHNQGKHYHKVYWPYLPLLAIIGLGISLLFPLRPGHGTLGYATDLSQTTLLTATNAQRVANGDKTLSINSQLAVAAQAKADDMAKRNYWSHITPDGQQPWQFVTQAGYAYQKAGENLAYGFGSSSETINGWMNSPSHRTNMLDESFTEVGFGFVNANNYQGHAGETIVVAMYASPAPAGIPSQPQGSVFGATTRPVSKLQSLSPNTQVLSFIIGLSSGLAITFLVLKHGFALRRLVLEGETFLLHHPILDTVLLVIITIGLILGRTSGFII